MRWLTRGQDTLVTRSHACLETENFAVLAHQTMGGPNGTARAIPICGHMKGKA